MATKVRIQFSVGVVDDDPNVTPNHERFVTFGDDVAPSEITSFFERCGLSVHNLFGRVSMPVALCLKNSSDLTQHKIDIIKLVREVSGFGLKEAKDIVEGNYNGQTLPYLTIGWCLDDGTAERIIELFKRTNLYNQSSSKGIDLVISRNQVLIGEITQALPKYIKR